MSDLFCLTKKVCFKLAEPVVMATGLLTGESRIEAPDCRNHHRIQQEQFCQAPVQAKTETPKPTAEEQAYESLKLDPKTITELRRFTQKEAEAFNTIISLLKKDKLTGNDGNFNKGDIESIVASEEISSLPRLLARRELSANPDLIEGPEDKHPRQISIAELNEYKAATATMEDYTKRIGFKDEKQRFIPCSQQEWIDFITALMNCCKTIPKTVSSRPLKTK